LSRRLDTYAPQDQHRILFAATLADSTSRITALEAEESARRARRHFVMGNLTEAALADRLAQQAKARRAAADAAFWRRHCELKFNPDQPRDDHGRWTSGGGEAGAPAPANHSTLPVGVDWKFIAEREGSRTDGYVPLDKNKHPDANSGVTIAVGFDLGGRKVTDLQALGLSKDLTETLTPYLGLHGQDAQNYLDSHPLNITADQAQQINTSAFNSYYNAVSNNYNNDNVIGVRFVDLPQGAQTAIVSVAYQYGTNLSVATPNFWTQVTNGKWQEAYDNFMNFGDGYRTRRQLEAGQMLQAIQTGLLPKARQNAN